MTETATATVEPATFITAPAGLHVTATVKRTDGMRTNQGTVVAFRVDGDKLTPYVFIDRTGEVGVYAISAKR